MPNVGHRQIVTGRYLQVSEGRNSSIEPGSPWMGWLGWRDSQPRTRCPAFEMMPIVDKDTRISSSGRRGAKGIRNVPVPIHRTPGDNHRKAQCYDRNVVPTCLQAEMHRHPRKRSIRRVAHQVVRVSAQSQLIFQSARFEKGKWESYIPGIWGN